MADYSGFIPSDDTLYTGGLRPDPRAGAALDPPGATAYVYLTTGGSIGGPVPSRSAVPAGASILYTRSS